MARLYEEIELRFDDADAPTVASIVKRARTAARGGDHAGAFQALLEVATHAENAGLTAVALELVTELRETVDLRRVPMRERLWLLNLQGQLASDVERVDIAQKRFDTMLRRARRLGDLRAASTALQNLGVNALRKGDVDSAVSYARAAYALKSEIGDEYGAAQVRLNTITALLSAQRDREAEKALERAEPQVRRLREPALLSTWYGSRAQLAVNRRDFASALEDNRVALRYARRAGDLEKVAIALQNLGATSNDLGSPRRALRWYEKALAATGGLGSPGRAEVLLRSRAVTLHRLGRDAEARKGFLDAQALAEHLGFRERALMSAVDAAALLLNMEEAEQAAAEFDELLPEIRESDGDPLLLVNALANAAAAYSRLGETETALRHLREALDAAGTPGLQEQRMGLARQAAETALASAGTAPSAPEYFELQLAVARELLTPAQRAWEAAEAGALLSAHGLHEASLAFFGRALATYSRQRNLRLAFRVRNDRALALAEIGRFSDAQNDLKSSLSVAEKLSDRVLAQQAQLNLGELARRSGRPNEAIARGRVAIELAQATGDLDAEAEAVGNLGLALLDGGDTDAAEAVYVRLDDLARLTRQPTLRSAALRGTGRVAEIRGDLSLAASRYRMAARADLRRPDDLRLDLLCLLAVLARVGTEKELQRAVQRLIDLAQDQQWEAEIAYELTHSVSLLVERDIEVAANLSAAAIYLAASRPSDLEIQDIAQSTWFRGVATVLVSLAYIFDRQPEHSAEQLWTLLTSALDAHEQGLAEAVRPMIEEARRVVADGE